MIRFELVTLAGTKFSQEVYEVLLPTPEGQIAVFANHMPLVSIAVPGIISVRRKDNEPDDMMDSFATNGGVIEILDNSVRVLVDEADAPDDLNAKEVEEALERAHEMRRTAKDQVELDQARQLIDRQTVKLKVAGLRRHRRQQK